MIIPISEFEQISLGEIKAKAYEQGMDRDPISIHPDVLSRGLIRVERHPNNNLGDGIDDFIVPVKIIGLLPVAEGISLWVNPRVPVNNIDFMAKRYGTFFSREIKELRKYFLTNDTSISLWENLARSLVSTGEQIVAEGIWREYSSKENSNGSFIGRIDVAKTINQFTSRNIAYKVASNYFVREIDIAPNRVLRQALQLIARSTSESNTRRRASRLNRAFQHISPLSKDDLVQLRDTAINLSNSKPLYYRALPIAEALLFDKGLDSSTFNGWLSMDSLFIDMSELFENYVRTVLASALAAEYSVVNGNTIKPEIPLFEDHYEKFLDSVRDEQKEEFCSNDAYGTKGNTIKPDIIIERDEKVLLSPDVKYKPIKGGFSAKREDIEQAVTYAHRLGLTVAITIHPCMKAEEKGLHYSGRVGSIHVLCYCINLGAENLEDEERDLVRCVMLLLNRTAEA